MTDTPQSKGRFVFDVESNGLFPDVDKIWISVFRDFDTKKEIIFTDYEPEIAEAIKAGKDMSQVVVSVPSPDFKTRIDVMSQSQLVPFLRDTAKELIGHNITTFDLPLYEKVLGWLPTDDQKIVDTLIYSKVLNLMRFGNNHKLESWGEFLGFPKPPHDDWSQYSEAMRNRCVSDVRINDLVFEHLIKEMEARQPDHRAALKMGIRGEHAASLWFGEACAKGWPFDVELGEEILAKIENDREPLMAELEPLLLVKFRPYDAKAAVKKPKFTKKGNYHTASTSKFFGIDPETGNREPGLRPIQGEYTRLKRVEGSLKNVQDIKDYLFSLGWKPTEFKVKRDHTGKVVGMNPQLKGPSMAAVGPVGAKISEYLRLTSRMQIMKGWLPHVNEQGQPEGVDLKTGRLYGGGRPIGTMTFRAAHQIIANLPKTKKSYGLDMRRPFICPEGYKIVGADSASNQARGLCVYLGDDDYTELTINGDAHAKNRDLMEKTLGFDLADDRDDPKRAASRGVAKGGLYALMFGAGDAKLGATVTGESDVALGKKIRAAMMANIPGLEELIKGIEREFEASKKKNPRRTYIYGWDYRPIFMPQARLGLNYRLQCLEKITCSLAIMWLRPRLKAANIWHQPLIFYHDEIQFMVYEKDAEQAAELAAAAFREGPKLLGVDIMDGDADIGMNYAETH